MILKASQRGGAAALGKHLLSAENEHVEIHEISGFASDTLPGALKEAQAVAKGTKCKQHLFSLSLSPPQSESVSVEAFESAVQRIEDKLGLSGQPRIIVFHQKEARIHAHAVWSRIDADTMTAKPLPFFKRKLQDVSRELFLEHGWQMPRGLADHRQRDPRNFTLAEWQKAKRLGHDPKALKAAIVESWAMSDSRGSFANALEQRGLFLARGDRRAYVALTVDGDAFAIARIVGERSKEIVARLGDPTDMRDVADTKKHIAVTVAPRLKGLIAVADAHRSKALEPLLMRRASMREQHKGERQKLDEGQRQRSAQESRERAMRLRHGIMGLWDRMTGRHRDTVRLNEADALAALRRDRDQRHELVTEQLKERRNLQREIVAVRNRHASRVADLYRDLSRQSESREHGDILRDNFTQASNGRTAPARPQTQRSQRTNGLGLDI